MKVFGAASALGLMALTSGGCAQLLGLQDTKFDNQDAMTDAASVCDGAPACMAQTGRSVCGVLVDTGTASGQPLRVLAPTGRPCSATGTTDGPCALSMFGQAMASYFGGVTGDRIAGEIDDCGRYVVPDIDASVGDVAVVVQGTPIELSASLLRGRNTVVGVDKDVAATIVRIETATAWASQIDSASPPTVTGSYLVEYASPSGVAISSEELRVGGGTVGKPPTQPWGVYFTGATVFGAIDPAATQTQVNGTALVVPPSGSFTLGGFRTGANCTPIAVQTVGNAFVHVVLRC